MSERILAFVRQAAASLDTVRDGPQIVSEASVQQRFNRWHNVGMPCLPRCGVGASAMGSPQSGEGAWWDRPT